MMTTSSWSVPWSSGLSRENTADDERHVLHPKHLTDRTFVAINLRCRSPPNDADFVRAAHVLRGKGRAVGQRPLAQVEVIRRFEDPGKPVLIARCDLSGRQRFFAGPVPPGTSRRIASASSIFSVPAPPHPVRIPLAGAAGENQNQVLAEPRDLRFDLRLRAVADADHRDDRATPMMIPSAVSADRNLFRRNARTAILKVEVSLIAKPLRSHRFSVSSSIAPIPARRLADHDRRIATTIHRA